MDMISFDGHSLQSLQFVRHSDLRDWLIGRLRPQAIDRFAGRWL